MATITSTGKSVIHDESLGLQNAIVTPTTAGDSDDNDIALTSLFGLFSTRLTALGAAPTTAMGAALSGYDATHSSGQDAFLIDPGSSTITDVRFTDSSGAALNGADSGKFTAGGVKIFLYTDSGINSDNNVLLGRAANGSGTADPNGAIVFAAYIEQTATGGKLWTVQYQPLKHANANDFDDSLNFLDKVYIGVDQALPFSLAGAPSGQNLFLMFTNATPTTFVDGSGVTRISDVAIIATGKDPVIGANGQFTNDSDTVNTSQAGGPTTFGTNSQMIVEQEGIRFSYVTGARQNVTIPNLDQNEADVEANADFTAFFGTTTATFDVVQLQSGKSAQVRLTAFSSDNDSESGTNFVDGYADDTQVNILSVTVTNASGAAPVIISFAGNGAFITGVKAGDTITFTTDGQHNRVLIENGAAVNSTGNTHADFDIGGFRLPQTSVGVLEIGSKIVFEDDGPSLALDPNLQDAPDMSVDESSLLTDGTNNLGTLGSYFTAGPQNFGSDSGTTVSSSFTLELLNPNGADSSLDDVATGFDVLLFLEGGQIVGRAGSSGGAIVFTFSLVTAPGTTFGDTKLDQLRAVKHPGTTDANDSVFSTLNDLIKIVRTDTITDADGDQATTSATSLVSIKLEFKDDGPSITVNTVGQPDMLTVDETVLGTNATAEFADNFGRTPSFGADGAGSVNDGVYALSVKSTGVDSGLDDVASGNSIFLYLESGQVVGRVGTSTTVANPAGAISFTVSVNATGTVTLGQLLAMKHPNVANPDDSITLAAADLIGLTRTDTVTDRDSDSASNFAKIDIGLALNFEDDGPSIAFDDLVGTGTDLPQYGFWSKAAGADGPNADDLQIALSGFRLGGLAQPAANFSLTEQAPSGGNYNFSGSLTGDFDNNSSTAPTTVSFTLTALANGQYKLDLATPVTSVLITDTAGGALGAGGPDPVQTLFIPPLPAATKETVVFFSAKNTATTSDIAAGIILGQTDPTEASLEGPPLATFIDARAMNVSTSGIGVANNVLEGATLAGESITAISGTDESFVVNPLSLVNTVRIFVDNSVAGYKYTAGPGSGGNERLFYTAYYADGTDSGLVLVDFDINTNGSAPKYFDVIGGAKMIDAVQLTMANGGVKIPNIQFITNIEGLAKDIGLDFTASLTDKDGDSATSTFSADLFTNEAADAAYDYELAGSAANTEAFNIDLASARNEYKVAGFVSGADKLVLIGDIGVDATDVAINNGGGDSIVTVTETGGQTTTVTVVGVDVAITDFVFGG